jgi:cyclopropane fatty-acyl-phospholipid synthase-like methyltransferase
VVELAADSAFSRLRARFGAWWHGYEIKPQASPRRRVTGSESEDDGNPLPQPSGMAEWSPERIAALQFLFGPGEDGPAASRRCKDLIIPLGLNDQMSVVEVGCKLGTGLRVIASNAGGGAWIDGVESEECFLEGSMRLISEAGLQKKAVPFNTTLSDAKIQKHRRDAIIAREAFHRYPDRKEVLQEVHDLLKPQGQMVFTDYVIDPMMDETDLEAWVGLHATPPNLVQLEELRSELIDAGFDVHVAKDETADYSATILSEVRRFALELKKKPVPKNMSQWVMTEVEYWARMLTAMESGALLLARFHVMKTFDDPFA